LQRLATLPEADLVVVAVTGALGLRPLLAALEAGKDVATANKEPLVAAGQLIMEQVQARNIRFLPIDSEHSAIFQVLQGQDPQALRHLILTASGGPFRDRTRAELEAITVEDALAHPTWNMGPKITVDSATLMNKGLEVLEARWLFDVDVSQIDIVIHPQSIVHSLVEFVDGSVLAQMDYPDMRTPIQFALTFPERVPSARRKLDLGAVGQLTFRPPDFDTFPALQLAYDAARVGGTRPAVLNAANEVAVQCFLERTLGFLDIPRVVGEVMARHDVVPDPDLAAILSADAWAREETRRLSGEW
jgi:1-deoxy-D-xylulose-5-phosphate reductoisomerase